MTDHEATIVRYRLRAGARWRTGRLVGTEADGTLRITDDTSGGLRSLPAERVERRVSGRQGALRWAAFTQVPMLW